MVNEETLLHRCQMALPPAVVEQQAHILRRRAIRAQMRAHSSTPQQKKATAIINTGAWLVSLIGLLISHSPYALVLGAAVSHLSLCFFVVWWSDPSMNTMAIKARERQMPLETLTPHLVTATFVTNGQLYLQTTAVAGDVQEVIESVPLHISHDDSAAIAARVRVRNDTVNDMLAAGAYQTIGGEQQSLIEQIVAAPRTQLLPVATQSPTS